MRTIRIRKQEIDDLMILRIAGLLSSAELGAFQEALADPGPFEDGRKTAGAQARTVKSNRQAKPGTLAKGLEAKVRKALDAHPVFRAAALPKDVISVLFSRYDSGMSYGTHVDNAIMSGRRSDLSFTLFLSRPEEYDGGALVMEGNTGEQTYKLPAGDLLLYPTSVPHRVEEVARGTRLAAVGWVRSFIRDPAAREVLFDLENVLASLDEGVRQTESHMRLLKVRSNLLRRWMED